MILEQIIEQAFPTMKEGDEVLIKLDGAQTVCTTCNTVIELNKIDGIYHGIRNGKDYPIGIDIAVVIFYLNPYAQCTNCGHFADTLTLVDEQDLAV